MSIKKQYINYWPLFIIVVSYISVAFFTFQSFGVKVVNDSHRYIEYAMRLENEFYFDPHNFWYIGYVIFIYASNLIHHDLHVLILLQYLFSLIATFCIFKTSFKIFHSAKIALISALAYIFFIETITWNSYVLPEGIYGSFIAISLYLLTHSTRKLIWLIITPIFVVFTCLIKPTGIAVMVALFAVGFFKLKSLMKNSLIRYSIYIVFSLLFIILINKMLNTFILIENYTTGEIVYGISTLPSENSYVKLLTVEVPDDLFIPPQNMQPVYRIILFSLYNPLFLMKLAFCKIFLFLLHVRPYWSLTHNFFIIIFLYPFYFFAVKEFFRTSTFNKKMKIFIITFLTFHIAIIALTSVDWDGRFLLPLLPLVFITGSNNACRLILEKVTK